MNSFFLITCFVAIWDEGILQQYRLLPTCDSSENSRSPIVLKGDKGDRGVPGKQGAKGIQGSIGVSGNDGVKGSKGDIANCSDLLHNLTERITSKIQNLNTKIIFSLIPKPGFSISFSLSD